MDGASIVGLLPLIGVVVLAVVLLRGGRPKRHGIRGGGDYAQGFDIPRGSRGRGWDGDGDSSGGGDGGGGSD